MRITARIDGDVKSLAADLDKQVRYAAAVALTKTAQRIQDDLIAEMRRVFDRPTRYTLNSLAIRPATKQSLEASVFMKEFAGKGTPAWKYLHAQIEGGSRRQKRFERSLSAAGLLPQGWFAVPGDNAQLDADGNMSRGQIVKILSALRASSDPTQNRNAGPGKGKMRNDEYFSVPPGHGLPAGVYLRKPRADGRKADVLPVIMYIRKAMYSRRFAFEGVASASAERHFEREFAAALNNALATAR